MLSLTVDTLSPRRLDYSGTAIAGLSLSYAKVGSGLVYASLTVDPLSRGRKSSNGGITPLSNVSHSHR